VSATPLTLSMPARSRSLKVPGLIVAGVITAALVLGYVGTNVYASLGQRDLDRKMDSAIANWASLDPLARTSVAYGTGDPVARLMAPAIGLDVVVAEGATPSVMRRAPGHLPGSVTPGAEGVAIVTANRLGFGSFFSRLGNLAEGDRIETQSALGRTTYTVIEVRTVSADRLDLTTDSTQRVLVLFGSARMWGGPDRLVIRAVAQEAPRL
jgi:LPXTG-site transpeptidase (sortase) family protein